MVLCGHQGRVYKDTQSDEDIEEGIRYHCVDVSLELEPAFIGFTTALGAAGTVSVRMNNICFVYKVKNNEMELLFLNNSRTN